MDKRNKKFLVFGIFISLFAVLTAMFSNLFIFAESSTLHKAYVGADKYAFIAIAVFFALFLIYLLIAYGNGRRRNKVNNLIEQNKKEAEMAQQNLMDNKEDVGEVVEEPINEPVYGAVSEVAEEPVDEPVYEEVGVDDYYVNPLPMADEIDEEDNDVVEELQPAEDEVVEEPVMIEEEKAEEEPVKVTEVIDNSEEFDNIAGLVQDKDAVEEEKVVEIIDNSDEFDNIAGLVQDTQRTLEEENEEDIMSLLEDVSDDIPEEKDNVDLTVVETSEVKKIKREVVSRSYLTKLSTLSNDYKAFYNQLKNGLLCYRGVHARSSHQCESFRYKGELLAKITVNGKIMKLHLKLNHEEFNYNKYFQTYDGDIKAYAEVPMTVKVKSRRGVANAISLFGVIMERLEVKKMPRYEDADFLPDLVEHDFSRLKRLGYGKRIQEQVGANEANRLLSDNMLKAAFKDARKVVDINVRFYPRKEAVVYVSDLEERYRAYETVTLTSLKSRKIVPKDTTFVKLLAKGELTKPLDVRLGDYSKPAAKMVVVVGGNIMIHKLI